MPTGVAQNSQQPSPLSSTSLDAPHALCAAQNRVLPCTSISLPPKPRETHRISAGRSHSPCRQTWCRAQQSESSRRMKPQSGLPQSPAWRTQTARSAWRGCAQPSSEQSSVDQATCSRHLRSSAAAALDVAWAGLRSVPRSVR